MSPRKFSRFGTGEPLAQLPAAVPPKRSGMVRAGVAHVSSIPPRRGGVNRPAKPFRIKDLRRPVISDLDRLQLAHDASFWMFQVFVD